MNITFANKKLLKYANDYKLAVKKMGKKRADIYIRRLDDMRHVNNYDELQYLPGNFHQLKGDRKGQWACDLDQPYRLIFKPVTIPESSSETYILVELIDVEIIDITDYH